MTPATLVVWCDGGARGNPGPAGAGVAITTPDGDVVAEIAHPIGYATNNVAEYTAAILGLRRARELGARRVVLRSDSKLLIEQLSGRWRVKHPGLVPLFEDARREVRRFDSVKLEHVPRERNAHADRLANDAMDALGADGDVPVPPEQQELF